MKNFFIVGFALVSMLFLNANFAFAQENATGTGSILLNIKLPDYTLPPTTSSKYKAITGQYLILKSITVTPSSDSAVFGWKATKSKGTPAPLVSVEYGKDNVSENKVTTQDGVTEKTKGGGLIIKNLEPNTEYRFRISASVGTLYNEGTMVRSQEFRFTTHVSGSGKKASFQVTTPKIRLKTFGTTKTSAKLVFQTDVSTTATLEYAEFKPYFVYTDKKEDSLLATTHTMLISGLKPDTLYPYKITAKSAEGSETNFDGFVLKTKSQTK